jgi:hypothetical protein
MPKRRRGHPQTAVLAVLMPMNGCQEHQSFFAAEQPESLGDDSYTSNSHAVSVPGAGNQNHTPQRRLFFIRATRVRRESLR